VTNFVGFGLGRSKTRNRCWFAVWMHSLRLYHVS
jgi:hypothetical protein